MKRWLASPVTLAAFALSGCYHYSFEQAPPRTTANVPTITYEVRRPTYLNGFVGNGTVDTSRYCAEPVRTELRVTATDVALSVVTILVYTPHTLYVTCPAGPGTAESSTHASR